VIGFPEVLSRGRTKTVDGLYIERTQAYGLREKIAALSI
jgi:hypothetical protein